MYCTRTFSSLPRFLMPRMLIPVSSASPRGSLFGSSENAIFFPVFCTAFQMVILSIAAPKVAMNISATRNVVNTHRSPSFRRISGTNR